MLSNKKKDLYFIQYRKVLISIFLSIKMIYECYVFFYVYYRVYHQYNVVSNKLLSDSTRINGADYEECW